MKNGPNKPNEPIYFVAPDDEIVEDWEESFKLFAAEETNTLSIDIHPKLVETLNVGTVQEFVMVLQHYPRLIDKFIFSVNLKFPEIPDTKLYLPEETWKNNPHHFRWFHQMSNFGPVLFFLQDNEARFFFIAGDLLANGKLILGQTPDGKMFIDIKEENMEVICNRIFTACWLFMMYAHGTDFDPQPAIESIIADFGMPIKFSDVFNKYQEDIKTGFYVRLQKQ